MSTFISFFAISAHITARAWGLAEDPALPAAPMGEKVAKYPQQT